MIFATCFPTGQSVSTKSNLVSLESFIIGRPTSYQETSECETHWFIMSGRIIDVRLNGETSYGGVNIRDDIVEGLSQPVDQKYLPGLLLYDEEGLRLYEDGTIHADEYYLFSDEETLLKRHACDIVQVMRGRHEDHSVGGVILELGAG